MVRRTAEELREKAEDKGLTASGREGLLKQASDEDRRQVQINTELQRRQTLRGQGLREPSKLEAGVEQQLEVAPEQIAEQPLPEEEKTQLAQTFEEQKVFDPVTHEPILPPEMEGAGVVKDIALNLLPENIRKPLANLLDFNLKDYAQTPEGAAIQAAAVQDAVISATSNEIDTRIGETEQVLIENGIGFGGLAAGAGGVLVAQTITRPLSAFVGTDKQISNLELALSQYNEMITIPARSIDSGLSPDIAFDKLNRMEEGILALESELKRAAITSPDVRISLRGLGVDARLIKLKEKLQEGRRQVAAKMAARAFGEVPVTSSVAFLQQLQNEKTKS